MNHAPNLLAFIRTAPTAYHAVARLAEELQNDGYTVLSEKERWTLIPGGKYYIIRNTSSIIAFALPGGTPTGYSIVAAHSDSPCFKLKEKPESKSDIYTRLGVEKYGSPILSTWLDRPLGVAGRIVYHHEDKLLTRLVNLREASVVIPSVAIHMQKEPTPGQLHTDYLPLYSQDTFPFRHILETEAEVPAGSILSHDLFLYNKEEGLLWGNERDYYSAPRIDNLLSVYAAHKALISSTLRGAVPVLAVFDNEEVGSQSRQGAQSDFLQQTLERIALALHIEREEHLCALHNSFLLSVDNAHAVHPNHPELSDSVNRVYMNEGIVIKRNASQKYTTDATGAAYIRMIAKGAGIQTQDYANRSDMPGGSTLGNLLNTTVSIPTADIGVAQLAMHSALETAGSWDIGVLIDFLKHFFEKQPIELTEA